MASTFINEQAFSKFLMESLNKEMLEAAEPVIQRAVQEAEKEIRSRVGRAVIALLENTYSAERQGQDIRILVKHVIGEK